GPANSNGVIKPPLTFDSCPVGVQASACPVGVQASACPVELQASPCPLESRLQPAPYPPLPQLPRRIVSPSRANDFLLSRNRTGELCIVPRIGLRSGRRSAYHRMRENAYPPEPN